MVDDSRGLFKDQEDWFQKASREVTGKTGTFLKDLAEQLQRDGVAAARERIDRLQAHRDAVLQRVDAAIDAEKAMIQRLSAKIAETRPADSATGARASPGAAAKASVAKKAAAPRKATAVSAKPAAAQARRS